MTDVFCNNCGHRNPSGSNFCSSCGQPLDRSVEGDLNTVTFSLDQNHQPDDVEISLDEVGTDGVLVATRGANAGSEFRLEHVITNIGRHPDSDVFLDDVTVSRRHVEVERTRKCFVVRDVGSLNGTYVNQRQIDGDYQLENGDELQVGKFKLVFLAGTET